MVLYLTGSFIPYQEQDNYTKLEPDECYGFFVDLKKEWPGPANLLYVPCDPDANKENAYQLRCLLDSFEYSDIPVKETRILGEVTGDELSELIAWSDVVYLSGGHAPTQLNFMKRIGLKEALLDYNGIIIGLSAGSMNAAYSVYLLPEFEGEAKDPNYVRFNYGLDLTNIQIIPHSETIKDIVIDGLNVIKDIALSDSFGRRFYLISDGSYFKVKNGKTCFRGKGQIIEDGTIKPLKPGNIVPYMGEFELPVIKSILVDGYDIVFTVNKTNEVCEVYHLSEELWETFENSKLRFKDICFRLSQMLVERERELFLRDCRIPEICKELEENGLFVRTVHMDTKSGRKAKNIRIRKVPGYPDWFLVVFFDITTAIDHDWMTDEYARDGFMERAKLFISELTEDEHYSLVYTNVKGFKAVNELFGNRSGDMVIIQTRDVLRKYLNPVILGRLESDHFVLITSDDNLKEKNLKALSRQVFKIESKEYSYEILCGIFSIKSQNVEVTQLLNGAKLAEKSVKSTKKGRLYAYYDDTMKENYIKQSFLLSELERGMADNEFEPYYQPVVDAKTGKIVGAEMLIRWNHKELGMVPPEEFVPVIESEGMISTLDDYMVKRGINFVKERVINGEKAAPCAINLSRVDFYDLGFIDSIFERLKEKGVDPSLIRFEVTESAYADLEAKAIDYLNKMRKQGVKILLDDYGSGMSSMSMLQTFDFDIIKLDMGFISKIGINDKVEAIIVSTINLAHSIGAKVTAEGVETEKQLKFLQDAGCDFIQGFFFYKPMSEKEFAKILSES